MQQHSVPQNITGFEFKLVGALTLRQFGYLAVAGIISFIFFVATSAFWKWFFIIPIALLSLALAFLPVGGVNFDKWIVLFLRALILPSVRIWHKEPKEISFLSENFSTYLARPTARHPIDEAGRSRLKNYLSQLAREKEADKLDAFRKERLASLSLGRGGTAFSEPRALAVPETKLLEKLEESLEGAPTSRLTPEELREKVAEVGILPKEGGK